MQLNWSYSKYARHTHTQHSHNHKCSHTCSHSLTHTCTHTLAHTAVQIIISIWLFCFPQNSFDAGNADLTVHDPHAIAGTLHYNIQYIQWTNIHLASSSLLYNTISFTTSIYTHTNLFSLHLLFSLSRCSQDVSAWVARSSSHEKVVLRMGKVSRVSGLVPRPGSVCYCVEM